MSSKKIGDCIIHGMRFPNVCTARRTRHPEILYEPPPPNYGVKNICFETEYTNIPPVPNYKNKWNVCQSPKNAKCSSACICPPKPCSIPLSRRLRNMFWTVVKVGIFAEVINLTDDLKIWSTAEETESLYQTVHEVISANEDETAKPELPGIQRVTYNIARKWNDVIIYIWFHLFGVHPSVSVRKTDDHES